MNAASTDLAPTLYSDFLKPCCAIDTKLRAGLIPPLGLDQDTT